ncbi:TOMM precursor leader peptide-binding protein [Micromonospora sp. NBC_01813]|uniref:TOMM precursor leader peptide-binding protein n=1 Tax=Micromonospora sp. NBC_01813 TaxID=2975988 RepID=UPI002DD8385E|nr:TOMM precursor leader peptide-binding protein [Micromonospora sp. NBC_01813]WSA07808.1 TOMM precursor leader peptide-binding protein [Micromonospora sp. NBC_01813]
MPLDLVDSPEHWARDCVEFEQRLRWRLGADVPVTVVPLGVRDELAVSDGPAAASVTVHLYGQHALVGPFPGRAAYPACPRCLARRWQAVRQRSLRDALELGGPTRQAGPSPFRSGFGSDAVAALVAAHLDGAHLDRAHLDGAHLDRSAGPATASDGYASMYLVDLGTLAVHRFPVVPDAECPSCGRGVADTPQGARPATGPTRKSAPDSFRLRPVDDYPFPVAAFVNPVCGPVGPMVGYDPLSPSTSAVSGSFLLRSGSYLRETYWGGHADSYARSARIGVLEGLERIAGMRAKAKRTVVSASLHELGDAAIDPRVCGLYSDAFYAANPWVTPFAPDRPIPWVWGHSLRDDRPVLVPEILAYYHAPGLENRFVQESSNGCASGGSAEEATYHGLMEVVERDAFLLSWYGKVTLPEIDPGTSARADTRWMVDRLEMCGYRARFFDARITFDVPVVVGVATRIGGGKGAICFGAGASLDPEAAMAAALCEIATDSVNLRSRTERDEQRYRSMVADFANVEALHDHPLVYGLPEMAEHGAFFVAPRESRAMTEVYPAAGHADLLADDLAVDLRRCVADVAAQGFDVVVVDQTLPEQRDLGLHTVNVLVPGLLPIDFGWTRQRAPRMPRMRAALAAAGLRPPDADLHLVPHPFP